MGSDSDWISDVRISMPIPSEYPLEVPAGVGWAFTQGGITHDISTAVSRQMANPSYEPKSPSQDVYHDADLKATPQIYPPQEQL
jgi:hypothetical protein